MISLLPPILNKKQTFPTLFCLFFLFGKSTFLFMKIFWYTYIFDVFHRPAALPATNLNLHKHFAFANKNYNPLRRRSTENKQNLLPSSLSLFVLNF